MKLHVRRLVTEKEELDARLQKLRHSLGHNPISLVHSGELELMTRQESAMTTYSELLAKRIGRAQEAAKNTDTVDEVAEWNQHYPIDTEVIFFRLRDPLRLPVRTVTTSNAWLLGGETPVIRLRDVSGAVALNHVVPLDQAVMNAKPYVAKNLDELELPAERVDTSRLDASPQEAHYRVSRVIYTHPGHSSPVSVGMGRGYWLRPGQAVAIVDVTVPEVGQGGAPLGHCSKLGQFQPTLVPIPTEEVRQNITGAIVAAATRRERREREPND